MKQIKVTFTGCLINSIGKTHKNTVDVEVPTGLNADNAKSEDLELIYAQLYKTHKHISNVKIQF